MRQKLAIVLVTSAVMAACGSVTGSSNFDDGADSGVDGGTRPPVLPGPFGQTEGGSDPTLMDGSLGSCDPGCVQGARCKYDVCVPDLGACTSNDTCPGDSYCDTDKSCVPYGVPPSKVNDPTCARSSIPGDVQPTVQCEWGGTALGDPTAAFIDVYTTPMVADLNLDHDPNKLQPSVVVSTWTTLNGERIGMLRVFDGRTCTEQMRIGGPDDVENEETRPAYGAQWAIGDLDNDVGTLDGHPEIVGMHRLPGAFGTNPRAALIAYKVDASGTQPRLVRKWTGRICGTNGAADTIVQLGSANDSVGPGIWDLDDDGKPEVVVDLNVFDNNGCLLNSPVATFDGHVPTVADVDLDGKPDLVKANGIYGWNTTTRAWEMKPWFVPNAAQTPGHVAVADMGLYSTIAGVSSDHLPEVIVVSQTTPVGQSAPSGTVRIQKLSGEIVFGPVPIFKFAQGLGGNGGPPTASDFDGDGYPEFAAAANEFYTVYDPDCDGVGPDGGVSPKTAAVRPGGKCDRPSYMTGYAGGPVPLSGVLWARPSQDFSSSATGSSIFDFNGDGKSEAVYGDECYLRVYEGATGNVLFSSPASSGTGLEMPVICDVDGDFATEIIVPRATNNPACPATDPIAPPLAPGQTAPVFASKGGFIVLRDPSDRWVASRPIWNQYAYSITNVTDDGRIPRSSAVLRNWEQAGQNNFRQNTQGTLGKLALADLTAQIEDLSSLCSGASGTIPLTTRVCNRGTNPVQDGVTIAFYSTARDAAFDPKTATPICQSTTSVLLNVGQCTSVSCTGAVAADRDLYVATDPAGKVADCHPGNNNGASARVLCTVVK